MISSALTSVAIGVLEKALINLEPQVEQWLINEIKLAGEMLSNYLEKRAGGSSSGQVDSGSAV